MDRACFIGKTSRRSAWSTQRPPKPSNHHSSDLAEDFVATVAVVRGWSILARKFRRPRCELDLVIERDGVLAIVEVKLRQGPLALDAMLPPAKRAALVRGAHIFLAEGASVVNTVRFDLAIVGIRRGRTYMRAYIADAFQA